MAKKERTKEIWHIPKRGNVHQTIYMVKVLSNEKFNWKTWTSWKQEALATEMAKAWLTKSGKSLSHQSVRTLLANLPKYLWFTYIDENSTPSRIFITDVWFELLKKHQINDNSHKNLKEYENAWDLIEVSDVFCNQLLKLIITNPSIKSDCINILVFPFKFTLNLLLELEYLDIEELSYIVFRAKAEDELPLIIQKIKNFRTMEKAKRISEINAFKATHEWQLTLVKAPSAWYYMTLCASSWIVKKTNKRIQNLWKKLTIIELIDKQKTKELIDEYKNAKIFDFGDDWFLWKEYYTVPTRKYTPKLIKFTTNDADDVLFVIEKDWLQIKSGTISNVNFIDVSCFPFEDYNISIYSLITWSKISDYTVNFKLEDNSFIINSLSGEEKPNIEKKLTYSEIINEFFSNKEWFDNYYLKKLSILENILKRSLKDNFRKWGRLEYIFYELLESLKNNNIIDDVFWFWCLDEYWMAKPAPWWKEWNPDIVFVIDEYEFILELTTIRGTRAQWTSWEASSVPDHIKKFNNKSEKKVIWIFSAPSIHQQVEQNLLLNAKEEKVSMIFFSCFELISILEEENKTSILNSLLEKAKDQLK